MSFLADLIKWKVARFSAVDPNGNVTGLPVANGVTGPFLTNGTVYASAFGIVDHPTLDQSSALLTLAAWCTANGFAGKIIWINGTIKHNTPIVWTGVVPTQATLNSNADEAFPQWEASGSVTFDYSGGTQGTTAHTFRTSGTGQAVLTKFSRVRWVGPGVQVVARTTLSVACSATQTSIQIPLGSGVAIGDAICVDADATSWALTTKVPWWATVTGVSHAATTTITFANQGFCANFAGSIGNVVVIYKQTRGVIVGGSQSVYQEIYQGVEFADCAWSSWLSALGTNDITGFKMTGETIFRNCMYGLETGYNCDDNQLDLPWMHFQYPSQTGTVAPGNRVVTGFASTAQLVVGASLGDITASDYSVAGSQAFPEHAVIVSIDSATQVTMSHACHASTPPGVRTFQAFMGIILTGGKGVSPWYPLQPAVVGGNGNRVNMDNTTIGKAITASARMIYHVDGFTNGPILIEDAYLELSQRIAMVGNQSGPLANVGYSFDRLNLSSCETFQGPWIESLNGNAGLFHIKELNSGGTTPRTSVFRGRFLWVLHWEVNNIAARVAGLPIFEADQYLYEGPNYIGPTKDCIFEHSDVITGLSNTVTVNGNYTVEPVFYDTHKITMSGNVNINAATYGAAQGKKQTYIFTQNGAGGYTPTFAGHFYTAAGGVLGATLGSGVANKVLVAEFRAFANNKLVLTNVPAWI